MQHFDFRPGKVRLGVGQQINPLPSLTQLLKQILHPVIHPESFPGDGPESDRRHFRLTFVTGNLSPGVQQREHLRQVRLRVFGPYLVPLLLLQAPEC